MRSTPPFFIYCQIDLKGLMFGNDLPFLPIVKLIIIKPTIQRFDHITGVDVLLLLVELVGTGRCILGFKIGRISVKIVRCISCSFHQIRNPK